MLLIIIWYFFVIIFGLGLGLNVQKLASEVLASFNVTADLLWRVIFLYD